MILSASIISAEIIYASMVISKSVERYIEVQKWLKEYRKGNSKWVAK